MRDVDAQLKAVSASEKELRDESRRIREDLERRAAMSKAEQTGKAAVGTHGDMWRRSEEGAARLEAQLKRLDERTRSVPRLDTLLLGDAHANWESHRLACSLRDAEKAELDSEG